MINIKAYTVPKKSSTGGSGGGSTVVNETTSLADNWFYFNSDYDAVCCRYNFYSTGSVTANGAPPEDDVERDDIVDNLETQDANKALSARMGYVLKSLIDNITTTGGGQAVITVDWSNVTNKPSTFAPSSHTHSMNDVTNLSSTISTQNANISSVQQVVGTHVNNSSIHLNSGQIAKLNTLTEAQFAKLADLLDMIDINTNAATITVNGSLFTSNDVTAQVT